MIFTDTCSLDLQNEHFENVKLVSGGDEINEGEDSEIECKDQNSFFELDSHYHKTVNLYCNNTEYFLKELGEDSNEIRVRETVRCFLGCENARKSVSEHLFPPGKHETVCAGSDKKVFPDCDNGRITYYDEHDTVIDPEEFCFEDSIQTDITPLEKRNHTFFISCPHGENLTMRNENKDSDSVWELECVKR